MRYPTPMTVRLVSKTSVDEQYQKSMNVPPSLEGLTAYIARVSSPHQDNPKYAKLLKYCIQHGHWSILEHVSFTMEIRAPRAITTQILRHRSFTFQEFSQRYAEVQATPYLVEARTQDLKNRQKSISNEDHDLEDWWHKTQLDVYVNTERLYNKALRKGIAKEQARFLLPMASASTIFMTGNLRNWVHYCELRCENGTQLEHQEIAQQCKDILIEQLPAVAEALGWISHD